MVEASIGVLLWLSIALLVGVIVGWYLNTAMKQKENTIELDILQKHYEEKEDQVKKLKEDYFSQKRNLDRLTDEGIVCRHQLLQKSNFLTKTSDELFKVQDKLREVKRIEKERNILDQKVTELSLQLDEKESELKELEQVLLKADTSLDEAEPSELYKENSNDKKYHRILTLESEVQSLKHLVDSKERLISRLNAKLSRLQESEDNWTRMKDRHIFISKDQFAEIEKRFSEYIERIKKLEEENLSLSQSYILQPKDRALNAIIRSYENLYGWKERLKQKFFTPPPKKTTKA